MSLSDTAIRTAKLGAHNYLARKMYDRDGLYLLVKTNGSKLWRHRYYMGGKEQLHGARRISGCRRGFCVRALPCRPQKTGIG